MVLLLCRARLPGSPLGQSLSDSLENDLLFLDELFPLSLETLDDRLDSLSALVSLLLLDLLLNLKGHLDGQLELLLEDLLSVQSDELVLTSWPHLLKSEGFDLQVNLDDSSLKDEKLIRGEKILNEVSIPPVKKACLHGLEELLLADASLANEALKEVLY